MSEPVGYIPDLDAGPHDRTRRADAYDLLVVEIRRLRIELVICERASQGNANAHMATHAELQRLRDDYRTLWGMTLGHDGQPPVNGTTDDIERLRARFTELGDQ